MIYLDYSSTTKVDERVLKIFNEVCLNYYGNYNSKHNLGEQSKKIIEKAILDISNILNIKPEELIFTSGATESNNMAIKGILLNDKSNRKHIISTKLEHSSISNILTYFSLNGYDIDFVNLLEDGTVDLEHLKSLLREDTILVTIIAVDSELGIRQPIEKISEILKQYPNCFFHTDITQCIAKNELCLDNVHFASFSAHKFFGLKGIGGLYIKNNISILPLIHGGNSISKYKGGTPSTELIVSMAEALKIYVKENNVEYILHLNNYLRENILKNKNIIINSTKKSIPNILNFSIYNFNQDELLKELNNKNIYVSGKSACDNSDFSSSIFTLYQDQERSKKSIRVSLSYKTTQEELDIFIKTMEQILNNN